MATGIGQHLRFVRTGPAAQIGSQRAELGLGLALVAVYLPHLIAYASNMMRREYYQFLPLAWLGAVVLVWSRRDEWKLQDGRGGFTGWIAVGGALLTLIGAGILASSWLAVVSILPMVFGLAWCMGGWGTARVTIPALMMFATTIRPPGTIDLAVVSHLRTLAVGVSSRLLDALGIIHVPLSNVLRVPGGDLLVDEACSGVNSLVSIVAVVLFLGLLKRRRPAHLGLLLIWSIGIVILANVGRVTIVTIAFARYKVDLLHGWRHDALGIALYGVSLGLVASLDQLILLFEPLFRRRHQSGSTTSTSGAQGTDLPATTTRPRQWTALALPLVAIALILPVQWARGIHPLEPRAGEDSHFIQRCQGILNEQTLPAQLAGWHRVSYKTEERQRDNSFGQFSSQWEYRLGDRTAVVSIDYPFVGWHELLICYSAINWATVQRSTQLDPMNAGLDSAMPYVSALLENGTGEYATLSFSLIADDDRWVDPPAGPGLGLTGRQRPGEIPALRPEAQVQLFSAGYRPSSAEDRRLQNLLFRAAALELKRRLALAEATKS